MELKKLRLMTQPGAWRMFMGRKADKGFRPYAQKVLERDNYICQFCGFQASEYQEVINQDNNYNQNKLDNMVTACCFCTQCFFIESIGASGFGGGTLIFLPELEQAELNAFCHVVFCAIANETAYKETSQKIYRGLKFRAQAIEAHYGDGTCKPSILARMVLGYAGNQVDLASNVFSQVRLLPSQAKFSKQIEAWAAAALSENEPVQDA